GLFGQRRETNQIREENCHRYTHATERAVVAVWIVENFLDQIFRDVAFERAPSAQFLEPLENVFETERKRSAQQQSGEDWNCKKQQPSLVIKQPRRAKIRAGNHNQSAKTKQRPPQKYDEQPSDQPRRANKCQANL